jgi:hypothetical protein
VPANWRRRSQPGERFERLPANKSLGVIEPKIFDSRIGFRMDRTRPAFDCRLADQFHVLFRLRVAQTQVAHRGALRKGAVRSIAGQTTQLP